MKVIVIVYMSCCLVYAKQVAYVDLTSPPVRPDDPGKVYSGCAVGGAVFNHRPPPRPAPGTPPVRLTLRSITPKKVENGGLRGTLEVEVTNTGATAYSVPVGAARDTLTGPGEKERRRFDFSISIDGRQWDASSLYSVAAANAAHPETLVKLESGDSAVYKLPFAAPLPADGAKPLPSVTVSLRFVQYVLLDGRDCETTVGDRLDSDNALPVPRIAGPQ